MQTHTQTCTYWKISNRQLRSAVFSSDNWWEPKSSRIWSFIRWASGWFSTLWTLKFTFWYRRCFSVGANSLWLTAVLNWKNRVCVCVGGLCVCGVLTSSARVEALWRTGVGLCLSYCLSFSWIYNPKRQIQYCTCASKLSFGIRLHNPWNTLWHFLCVWILITLRHVTQMGLRCHICLHSNIFALPQGYLYVCQHLRHHAIVIQQSQTNDNQRHYLLVI